MTARQILDHALKLSIDERIELAEQIWESIGPPSEYVELSDEDRAILESRLESWRKNPEATISWDELKRKLLDRR